MIDDKDVKKLIKAMKDVFPTAKVVKDSFDSVATKVEMETGFKKVNDRLDTAIGKHDEEIKGLKERVVVLEKALEIE